MHVAVGRCIGHHPVREFVTPEYDVLPVRLRVQLAEGAAGFLVPRRAAEVGVGDCRQLAERANASQRCRPGIISRPAPRPLVTRARSAGSDASLHHPLGGQTDRRLHAYRRRLCSGLPGQPRPGGLPPRGPRSWCAGRRFRWSAACRAAASGAVAPAWKVRRDCPWPSRRAVAD